MKLTKNKKTFIVAGVLALYLFVKKKSSTVLTKQDYEKLNKDGNVLSPVKGKVRITSGFGSRIHPVTKTTQFHNGSDIVPNGLPASGTPIQSSIDGVVEKVFTDNLNGNGIVIVNGAIKFGYAHLLKPSTLKAGESVKKGQIIGYIGSTGRSTGAHLHLTMRIDNVVVNPVENIKKLKESIA